MSEKETGGDNISNRKNETYCAKSIVKVRISEVQNCIHKNFGACTYDDEKDKIPAEETFNYVQKILQLERTSVVFLCFACKEHDQK